MDTITRKIADLSSAERSALEHVLGRELNGAKSVVIQLVDSEPLPALPDWCNVYEGLDDARIDELSDAITRIASSRTCELP